MDIDISHRYFGCSVCMDKALYQKFIYTAEIKDQLNELTNKRKC